MNYMENMKDLQTKVFFNFKGCIENIGTEFKKQYPDSRAFVVCDCNTLQVAGNKVIHLLKKSGIETDSFILRDEKETVVEPYYSNVKEMVRKFPPKDFIPVAVGSGTINDLVKRAAHERKVPYVCVPTASSVDGYCSFGAALIVDGFKMTMDCPAPEMIIADSDILKTAPLAMTSAGYGDLYSKSTAGTDWIIADMIGIEPIETQTWSIVQKDLHKWLKEPQRIGAGDSKALSGLFEGLCAAGLAIQIYGTSRPASGLEHMLSHVWEMENEKDGLKISHGYKVSIGILISTAITESFLDYPVEALNIQKIVAGREDWQVRKNMIRRLFTSTDVIKRSEEVCQAKWVDDKELERRLSLLKDRWGDIRTKIKEHMIPFKVAKSDLMKAGCPTSMEEIGLSRDIMRDSIIRAQMIRDRYILLESVYECGLFTEILNNVETYF